MALTGINFLTFGTFTLDKSLINFKPPQVDA